MCQHYNCRIFTTVSDDEKRKFLCDKYELSDSHIFTPNQSNFADKILEMTNGNGVNLILNSLSSDKLPVSCQRIIANYGRYIEIDNYGQSDTNNNQIIKSNTLYYSISSIISEDTFESLIPKIFKIFALWFNEGITKGLQQFLQNVYS